MAVTNIFGDKEIRYVNLNHPTTESLKFLYVFRTNVDSSEVVVLKQTAITGEIESPAQPMIIGTRRPTPLIMRRSKKTPKITTLCSSDAYSAALADGWRRVQAETFRSRRDQDGAVDSYPADVTGSILVSVKIQSKGKDITWGWYMPKQQARKVGTEGMTALGISIPSTAAEFNAVIIGSNYPRPPRAARITTEDGEIDRTETYYSTEKTLPDGWSQTQVFEDFKI